MKKNLRKTILDIVLNVFVPYAIYTILKKYFGFSEVWALTACSLYPVLDIAFEFFKDTTLNFISLIVLLGTLSGILGAFIGGDPKLILVRESFFTCLLGIACFITLFTGKPLIFYFAREFVAGKDSQKRKEFTDRLQKEKVFAFFRLITLAWGIVYLVEFALKIFIVYHFSVSLSLIIAPISTYFFTFSMLSWTLWYAARRQKKG